MGRMGRYVYPARECPSFQRCAAPLCPLDPDMEKRVGLEGEEECRATRRTREAIAARYPGVLKTGGLKASEVARDRRRAQMRERWEAMSEEERARFVEQGRAHRRKTPPDLPHVGSVSRGVQKLEREGTREI